MIPDSSVSIDDSRWPLWVVRFVGTATPRQHEYFLEEASTRLLRRERFIAIIDLSQGGIPSAGQRQRQIFWLQEYESLMRDVVLGVAFIIHSPLIRLAVSAILHFKPLRVPYLYTSQEEKAAAWASSRFEEQGSLHTAELIREQYGLPPRAA